MVEGLRAGCAKFTSHLTTGLVDGKRETIDNQMESPQSIPQQGIATFSGRFIPSGLISYGMNLDQFIGRGVACACSSRIALSS